VNSNFTWSERERERDLCEGSGGAVSRVWEEGGGDFVFIEGLGEITWMSILITTLTSNELIMGPEIETGLLSPARP
jgi:hypothetical protein